jgi:hypothetical protein
MKIIVAANSTPTRSDDRTKVRCGDAPANAVADYEGSGLVAGHLTRQIIFGDTL